MSTYLTTPAIEQSTYAVVVVFNDENGDNVTPNAGLTWTLTNCNGDIVNGREDVAIASAGTVTIALYGNDLDLDDGTERYLLVEGTYTSSLGADLPLKSEARFRIVNLNGIS